MTIFDIAKNISQDRKELDIEEIKNIYSQFMINRIMSCSPDLVFLANEANKFATINIQNHYDFWFGVTHKKKRYFKYPKQEKFDNTVLEKVKEYYNVSEEKGLELLQILTDEETTIILDSFKHGKM